MVYQVTGTIPSDFQSTIDYLTSGQYPDGLSRKEKIIFQFQMAPFSLIKGVLFRMGADDKLRRCLEPGQRRMVIRTLHEERAGGHFVAINTVVRIQTTGYWWLHLN